MEQMMAFNPNALSPEQYAEAQRKYAAPNYDAVAEALAYAQAKADQERARRPVRKSGRKASSQPASPIADMALGGLVADAMQKAAEQRQIEKRGINEDAPLKPSHTTVDDTPAGFLNYINTRSEYAPALQAIEEGIDTAPVGALGSPLNALAKSPVAKSVLERISNLFRNNKAQQSMPELAPTAPAPIRGPGNSAIEKALRSLRNKEIERRIGGKDYWNNPEYLDSFL